MSGSKLMWRIELLQITASHFTALYKQSKQANETKNKQINHHEQNKMKIKKTKQKVNKFGALNFKQERVKVLNNRNSFLPIQK